MTERVPRRERLVTLLCVASFLACTLFLFGPLHLFFDNRAEFYIGPLDLVPLFAAVCLAAAGVITLVFLPLPSRLFTRAVALLFMIAVLFWIQGNLLVWRVGVLNGREIPWASHRAYGFADGAVWIALLAVALVKPDLWYGIARRGSAAFLLIQLVSTFVTAGSAPGGLSFYRYTSDETDRFTFSTRRNVIILVLDTFQSDLFQEITDRDGRCRNAFSGFTYFRNALGGYPTTYASVPLILTGKHYDNSIPIQQFIETAYSAHSLPLALRREGWRVYLPLHYAIFNDERLASNLRVRMPAPLSPENAKCAADLYDAALLRYVPYFAKNYIYRNGQGLLKRYYALALKDGFIGGGERGRADATLNPDVQFIEDMMRRARVSDEADTFAYFHLVGLHPPFTLNEDLKYEEMPFTRESCIRQARAMLKITEEFLAKLRALGVYDSSTILVIADHGFGFPLSRAFCAMQERNAGRKDGRAPPVDEKIIASGVPLFLVKPAQARGAMRVSEAPVSLGDIPATIASELGIADVFPGSPVFAIKPAEDRERRFLFYDWVGDWDSEYLPVMTEYVVRGVSACGKSWASTGRRFSPPSRGEHPAVYTPGTAITFGLRGNFPQYAGEGWSVPEGESTFTRAKSASCEIPLLPPRRNLMMRVSLSPFQCPGRRPGQRVDVYVNDQKVAAWKAVAGPREYAAFIPLRILIDGALRIRFELPDAVSPFDAGIGNDRRVLGIALQRLTLWAQTPYRYGTPIVFGENGDALPYEESGWSLPEGELTWTDGDRASLVIPAAPPQRDMVMRAVMKPFLVPGKVNSQRVKVSVNGRKIGKWKVVPGEDEYRVVIPKWAVKDPLLSVTFFLPDRASPRDRGISGDDRTPGVGVRSVVIEEGTLPPSH